MMLPLDAVVLNVGRRIAMADRISFGAGGTGALGSSDRHNRTISPVSIAAAPQWAITTSPCASRKPG